MNKSTDHSKEEVKTAGHVVKKWYVLQILVVVVAVGVEVEEASLIQVLMDQENENVGNLLVLHKRSNFQGSNDSVK